MYFANSGSFGKSYCYTTLIPGTPCLVSATHDDLYSARQNNFLRLIDRVC